MHQSALLNGQHFFEAYWKPEFKNILDIGSRNVNGTLRDVRPEGCGYLGIDLEAGPGVDLVLSDPHQLPLAEQSFDIVVSTSCLEHDPMFWLTFLEMCRILRDGGYIYINAPSNGPYHGYPYDHWRFYPDSGMALASWAQRSGHVITLLESFTNQKMAPDPWADLVMIFGKGPATLSSPPLFERMDGSRNVRHQGNDQILKFSAEPEDRLELLEAKKNLMHPDIQASEKE